MTSYPTMSEMLLADKAMFTSRFPARRIAGSNPTKNTCYNLINEETIMSDSSIVKIPRLSMIS